MVEAVRGGLRPATNSTHLTTPPPGLKNNGTIPAARPDVPPRPPPAISDQTETTLPLKPDRWIEAKKALCMQKHLLTNGSFAVRIILRTRLANWRSGAGIHRSSAGEKVQSCLRHDKNP